MVQVCNLLLGFSVAIVAFAFGANLKTRFLTEQCAFSIMALLGLIISLVSALVALTYGGYANRNWAKADQIARRYGWEILNPNDLPWAADQMKHPLTCRAKRVLKLSAPVPTYHRLAPIFVIYFRLSLLSAVVHFALLVVVWVYAASNSQLPDGAVRLPARNGTMMG